MSNNTINKIPSFKAYMKFKAEHKKINLLIDTIKETTDDAVFLNRKKGKHKDTVDLLTGSHYNKFLAALDATVYIKEFKKNLSKFFDEKPLEKDAAEVIKAIKRNKFDFETGKIK